MSRFSHTRRREKIEMTKSCFAKPRFSRGLVTMASLIGLASLTLLAPGFSSHLLASSSEANPWNSSELVEPAELARLLSKHVAQKPIVVCVGFNSLYSGAHIPGAAYAGPARQANGLAALKKWAASIPRHHEVILYCGCCPMHECPNVRPAFEALKSMGFSNLKVLDLPDNFQQDWVAKGYPAAKE
jgi:thiosulfate/3-mercaptopyruvate sulfurtransferase